MKARERDAIIQSLSAGVVPAIGLQYIQVGRKNEVESLLKDLIRIEDTGAAIRFIIGRFGSGKSFFLNLIRTVALERNIIVVRADITTEHRLQSSGGKARALYSELMRNLSSRTKPAGGALESIIENWISDTDHEVQESGGGAAEVEKAIKSRLRPLQDLVSGFDFASVLCQYYKGHTDQNDALMDAALRWLRAEYSTKTEARSELGVRTIIDDSNIYDYLKLMASFLRLAGYKGLVVLLDEMGVLSERLNNASARIKNYEMILRILNDALQGTVSSLGFIFAGTDGFLEDRRRGLYSYEALATRLARNQFATDGLKDLSGPVVHLDNLTVEDLYVLFHNIRNVFASGDESRHLIDEKGIQAYMESCSSKLGAEYFLTPRDAIKGFVGLLSILEQNPDKRWHHVLGAESNPEKSKGYSSHTDTDEDLSSLRL